MLYLVTLNYTFNKAFHNGVQPLKTLKYYTRPTCMAKGKSLRLIGCQDNLESAPDFDDFSISQLGLIYLFTW